MKSETLKIMVVGLLVQLGGILGTFLNAWWTTQDYEQAFRNSVSYMIVIAVLFAIYGSLKQDDTDSTF